MKKLYVLLLGTLLLLGCVESSSYSPTPKPTATTFNKAQSFTVTKVIDGDTLELNNNEESLKIRMIGIDATEVAQHECFSTEATNKLKELIGNNQVVLERDPSQGEFDKYQRTLGYIFLPNGTNLNLELIKQGYVHEYTYNKPYKYQQEFKAVEREARESEMGLWASNACGQENITPTPVSKTGTSIPTITRTPISTKVATKSPTTLPTSKPIVTPKPTTSASSGFTCNCAKTCTQITTCAEAYFQLNSCDCFVRDGDKDGIPCEEIC